MWEMDDEVAALPEMKPRVRGSSVSVLCASTVVIG